MTEANTAKKLQSILTSGQPRGWRGKLPWLLATALLLGVLGWLLLKPGNQASTPRYLSEAATRATLTLTVSATGNLQPTNEVDVGSELSGTIETVLVDDNSRVKKDQVLARLDASKLKDAIAKSRAALLAAQATVAQAEATLKESKLNIERLREVARLSGGKVPSKTELASGEATMVRAEANLAGARAAVSQAQATLSSDETNLSKASIHSPINGVVLLRKVEPGQTVAASLSAPVLFTLAEDLTQMELQVNVDEADVGQVKAGQQATFSVDAWPNRKYPARVTRVRYGSQTTDGVVSYLTVLKVDNADLSLRPGMTATAEIIATAHADALLIPNTALRFSPPVQSSSKASSGGVLSMLMPRMPRDTGTHAPQVGKDGMRTIWILQGSQPQAMKVRTGISNGRYTEVIAGDLVAGARVITDLDTATP